MRDRLAALAERIAAKKMIELAAASIVIFLILPAHFLTSPFAMSYDSFTYTNEPGLSQGVNPNNFADYLRTPGYPLFLALTSFGRLPHPDAIVLAPCGDAGSPCDTEAAKLGTEVTVALKPFVFGFSQRTRADLQHSIFAARVLFLLSLAALYLCLTDRIGSLFSVVTLAAIVSFMDLAETRFLDVAATECLFPTLLFLYLATVLRFIKSHAKTWVLIATVLALGCFLVRPAMLYVPIGHLAMVIVLAWRRRSWSLATLSGAATAVTIAWILLWSPVHFFSDAAFQSSLLRTAVLSDASTADCIADPSERRLLSLYLASIADKTHSPATAGANYVRRYFDFGLANSYRIWMPDHPIYRQPGIAQLLDDGQLPVPLINRMLASAFRCNLARNVEYTAYNTAMMLGLTPVITPHAPHYFFKSIWVLPVSLALLLSAGLLAFRRSDSAAFIAITVPVLFYFGTIAIVALKQGGEARYSRVVEPLFVLSVAIAVSYLVNAVTQGTMKVGNRRSIRSNVDGLGWREA